MEHREIERLWKNLLGRGSFVVIPDLGSENMKEYFAKIADPVMAEKLMQWSVLDSIFVEFATTNELKKQHADLQQLLDSNREYHPKYYKYRHESVPYLATVEWLERGDRDILCIRLNHNGYIYSEKGKTVIARECSRHNFSDWVQLDETDVRKSLPRLFEMTQKLQWDDQPAFSPAYKCVVYYHPQQQRVDIRLRSVHFECPDLDICYEGGSPFEDPW